MNTSNKITDAEFVPFLHSLGVETYNKSFEWMLNDPDFADVLGWIYHNLDENNALTAREESRYSELEKQNKLLSPEELESKLSALQDEFQGLCLPGDKDGLEDVKLDITMQKERLAMLKRHENVLKELVEQNESTKEELDIELTKLKAAEEQAADDVRSVAEECMQLAKQLDSKINSIVDIVANALNEYSTCAVDKEVAKRFFAYGPFETYRQSQEMFRSHFDSYTSLMFDSNQNKVTDEEMRIALLEAKNMEKRLSDTIVTYIDTKADLDGEQAKLSLILNYPARASQITVSSLEILRSNVHQLEQEESSLVQRIPGAVEQFVGRRTEQVVGLAAGAALAVREGAVRQLGALRELAGRALSVDRLLYCALRRELAAAEELLHFAARLRASLLRDERAVAERIKLMNETCMEQELAEMKLDSSDALLHSLYATLRAEPGDAAGAVQLYHKRKTEVEHLRDSISERCRMKEAAIHDIKSAAKPLHDYICAGGSRGPVHRDTGVPSLAHALSHAVAAASSRVGDTTEEFNAIKNGDKDNMRKLWQWFITDPAKIAAITHEKK